MKTVISIILLLIISFLSAYSQEFDYSKYGEEMPIFKSLNIGPCMDAAIHKDRLFVIGHRTFYVFDIKDPKNPIVIDSISNLGNVRQLEIQEGYAYITSREDGMFVVSINDVHNMTIVAHYDSVELATGLHISGKIGAITNRIYGIELVDISNPKRPKHISSTLTDEAQSLFIHKNYVFVGDWVARKLIILDISQPNHPKKVSDVQLDGYGDGIFIQGDLCFVATGHHGAGLVEKVPTDPAWGAGHGLEIIDISNMKAPKRRSMVKFPKYYQRSPDWWDVQAVGNYAFVGDTKAGLFIVDTKNRDNPQFKGHVKLPRTVFRGEAMNDPVNGFAVGKQTLYIAGSTGLHLVDASYLPQTATVKVETSNVIPPINNSNNKSRSTYHTGTQIYSVCLDSLMGAAYVAAGSGGVHEVKLSPAITGKQLIKTESVVYDVQLENGKLFVAEGKGGLSVWEISKDEKPKFLSRYFGKEGGVYQVVIDHQSKRAALHVGTNTLDIIDIANPLSIKRLFTDVNQGTMYRFPISKQIEPSGIIGCLWLVDCYTYDIRSISENPNKQKVLLPLGASNPSLGPINGFTFLPKGLIATYGGELIIKQSSTDNLRHSRLVNSTAPLSGKVTLLNSTLYATDRREGKVSAVDISDLNRPKLLWKNQLKGHPGYAVEYEDMVIVPAGYGGLQFFNKQNGTPLF